MDNDSQTLPEVSIIIPCYNQAAFLTDAVKSILDQKFPSLEIIIINDGSTDKTKEIVLSFPLIKYIEQENQGLSAARNAGINISEGNLLIFLDADDILLPGSIDFQVDFMKKHPEVMFASGGHIKADGKLTFLSEEKPEIKEDHYLALLKGNYIGMHAAVIYRREVFNHIKFDTSLKAVEDYDLYLKIASKFKVAAHTQTIATYRLHGASMSFDLSNMLEKVLFVLKRHSKTIIDKNALNALNQGLNIWKEYYTDNMYIFLNRNKERGNPFRKKYISALRKHNKRLFFKYTLKSLLSKRS